MRSQTSLLAVRGRGVPGGGPVHSRAGCTGRTCSCVGRGEGGLPRDREGEHEDARGVGALSVCGQTDAHAESRFEPCPQTPRAETGREGPPHGADGVTDEIVFGVGRQCFIFAGGGRALAGAYTSACASPMKRRDLRGWWWLTFKPSALQQRKRERKYLDSIGGPADHDNSSMFPVI
ncbi:hypothetical protein BD413DRAFT_313640 [Trametes elegans]|nr:hypothetical protein BD413DRAFT_313640 [Trametes elegans]